MSIATTHQIGDVLGGCKVAGIIEGTPIRFERRRYPGQFYCWVEAWLGGQWVSLGDPWPCATPKRTEIAEAIRRKR